MTPVPPVLHRHSAGPMFAESRVRASHASRAKASQAGSAPAEVEPRQSSTVFRGARRAVRVREKRMVVMSSSNPVERIRNDAFEKAAPRLAELAVKARALGKRMLSDVLELGEIFLEARSLIAHGHWLRWLENELGLSEDMARRFMDVSEMSKFRNLRDLGQQIPLSALYALARPSTSEETRDAVLALCEAGETVSLADVQVTIAEAKKLGFRPPYTQAQASLRRSNRAVPDERTRAGARSASHGRQ